MHLLLSLRERKERHDPDIAHEAVTPSQQLTDFSFLVSSVIWYDMLFQINVSVFMQSQNFGVSKSVQLLEGCHEFLNEYTENGLQKAILAATDVANDLQVEQQFQSVKRVRHVKRHFRYEARDEPLVTPENKSETTFQQVP
jgi:hypothetical protein